MKKLNSKGFTLVEILAVVVILGVIMAIMVPNVSILLDKSKADNIKYLESSIVSAAKMYISDYKYEISVNGSCSGGSGTLEISKISDQSITDSKVPISILVSEGNLSTDANEDIFNPDPLEKEKKLNKDSSYIEVLYDCATKGYKYGVPNLVWE